jgi:hypothetical protein
VLMSAGTGLNTSEPGRLFSAYADMLRDLPRLANYAPSAAVQDLCVAVLELVQPAIDQSLSSQPLLGCCTARAL